MATTLMQAVKQIKINADLTLLKANGQVLIAQALKAKDLGRGCVLANGLQAIKTGLIHWTYLPLDKMPPDPETIALAKRTDAKHPLLSMAVVVVRPDETKAAYLLSFMVPAGHYMVHALTEGCEPPLELPRPGDAENFGFVVIDQVVDEPTLNQVEIARILD